MLTVWAGEVRYEEALRWQRLLSSARAEGAIDDVLLVLTHDPVYTAGRRADVAANVLGTQDIRVVPIDRGGDVTYHGPGQLVAYPIVALPHRKAVRSHVEALETACVRTAASYGVAAEASTSMGRGTPTGVWVDGAKLAAIGIRVDQQVTSHGLAFNVDPDLDHYTGIVPCGLPTPVTSLAALGVDTTLDEVRHRLTAYLGEELGRSVQPVKPSDLGLYVGAGA